jgi:hypothetical protein
MQYIIRYEVKEGESAKFRRWLLDNENKFNEHTVPGWKYLGTWFTVRGFGRYSVETRWELEGYAALGAGFGDEINEKLTLEWYQMVDWSQGSEAQLVKSHTEVELLPGT